MAFQFRVRSYEDLIWALACKENVSADAFLWTEGKRFYEDMFSQFPKFQSTSSESYKVPYFVRKCVTKNTIFPLLKQRFATILLCHFSDRNLFL
jgi:hypothetical protein